MDARCKIFGINVIQQMCTLAIFFRCIYIFINFEQIFFEWAANNKSSTSKLFWVLAEAGIGKSAFAASLVCKLILTNRLLAVFFCKYGVSKRTDGANIIKSIAYQIAEKLPECLPKMIEESTKLKDHV
jgi:hypothetical protein